MEFSQPIRKKGKQAPAAKGAVAVRVKSKARFGKGAPSFSWFKPTEEGFVALYKAPALTQVEWVKSGLGARDAKVILGQLRVSQGEALTALHIPVATVNRKAKSNAPLSPAEGERVLGFGRLLGQLQTMVRESGNPEGFDASAWLSAWMSAPVPALGGARPMDLMDTMTGQALVSQLLAQMQSGAYRLSRIAYRIGTDTPDYEADDLSGKGAEITGGRWNEKGMGGRLCGGGSLACLSRNAGASRGGRPSIQPVSGRDFDPRSGLGCRAEGDHGEPARRLGCRTGKPHEHQLRHCMAAEGAFGSSGDPLSHRTGGVLRAGQSGPSRQRQHPRHKVAPLAL